MCKGIWINYRYFKKLLFFLTCVVVAVCQSKTQLQFCSYFCLQFCLKYSLLLLFSAITKMRSCNCHGKNRHTLPKKDLTSLLQSCVVCSELAQCNFFRQIIVIIDSNEFHDDQHTNIQMIVWIEVMIMKISCMIWSQCQEMGRGVFSIMSSSPILASCFCTPVMCVILACSTRKTLSMLHLIRQVLHTLMYNVINLGVPLLIQSLIPSSWSLDIPAPIQIVSIC